MGRRGGGRMGGGLGGGRSSGGRGFGSSGSRPGGSFGGGLGGLGGGRPAAGRGVVRPPVARPPVARRPMGRAGSFGAGMGVGMGMGMMGRRRMGWGWGGWGWGPRRRMMMGGPMMGGPMHRGGGCGGCMGGLLALVLVIFVVSLIGMFANFAAPTGGMGAGGITSSRQVTRSTVRRNALPRGEADSTVPMYVDHLGLIRNSTVLNRGLANFQDRTGVRPILYIVGPAAFGGATQPTDSQLDAFAQARYDAMTSNEAHLLFLFFYNGSPGGYALWNVAGRQAQTVMDGEAWDILMDYVEMYYARNLQWHDRFARAFDEGSQRIMTVTRSGWIPVLVVAGVLLILLLLFTWWKRKRDQKNLEFEQTERILSQPLETIGGADDAATQLAQQYEDENNEN